MRLGLASCNGLNDQVPKGTNNFEGKGLLYSTLNSSFNWSHFIFLQTVQNPLDAFMRNYIQFQTNETESFHFCKVPLSLMDNFIIFS